MPFPANIAHAGLSCHTSPLAVTPSIGLGGRLHVMGAGDSLMTPIPAALSSSPTGAGPTSLHSAANIRHLTLSTTIASSPTQRQLSLPGEIIICDILVLLQAQYKVTYNNCLVLVSY